MGDVRKFVNILQNKAIHRILVRVSTLLYTACRGRLYGESAECFALQLAMPCLRGGTLPSALLRVEETPPCGLHGFGGAVQ